MANMDKKKSWGVNQRIDPMFNEQLKELAKFRYFKNLAKKEPTPKEMTKLIRRTDSWKNVIFELKTRPKKEDLL